VPTPVGHCLAAGAIALAARRPEAKRQGVGALGLLVVANLPDIDFLFGMPAGDASRYHWGPTHSITAALIAGALAAVIMRLLHRPVWRAACLTTAAWASHVLLDLMLGPVHSEPYGLSVFWPFADERRMLPWAVFHLYPGDEGIRNPFTALFHPRVLPLIGRELLVLGPIVLAAWVWQRRRGRAREPEPAVVARPS
jgi:membrane-bound metal-dependent hydrolase YbcI (DUF457 family)